MESSSSVLNWVYDVFPSFSGEDVRVTFLSHFLKELDRKLIIAFKDKEIERSKSLDPELKQAIKDSRIAVVVFSKNYASSSWCLNELLEIVKCKKEFGQMVIPVFYGLDPSHVRKQAGDFGKMFEKTCRNKTKEIIIQWRKALTDVSNILGYHSVTWGNEAQMIEEITNDVSGKLLLLSTKKDSHERCIGIDDHIAKLILLLELKSMEVRMVGIWGSSGIGKTSIARALFSRLSPHFQGSIYIDKGHISESMKISGKANMDDCSTRLSLQRIFLSEILGINDIKINHLGALPEILKARKVLIFIDDLNDLDVLNALAGQNQWFGIGSRIIVITNDRHLLVAHGINHIYEVGLLSEELASQMFCLYAFGRNSPPEGFEDIAAEVVRSAGNLPLAVKVLGSSLRGRDKAYWMGMCPSLQNRLDNNIESVLRLSYEGLDSENDKAIFRHIACLFNLEKVNHIKLLLADSFLDFEYSLRILVDKSLVSVRFDGLGFGVVHVHSLLQQLGKEIVRKQSTRKPGKREFLVNSQDICNVLQSNTGTEAVIGISLNIDEIDELLIHESAFKGMHNLRFLTIFSNNYMLEKEVRLQLPDSFDFLPPKLKLLCWDGYPMKSMPSNFHPENLVKLKMKNSKLKTLWEGSRMLTFLREINLWGSENLKEIPDLSMAINLEKLYLGYRLSWVESPYSIRKFNELTELGKLECRDLDTLPTDSNFESPKRMALMERSRLWLQNSFDFLGMENIEKLRPSMQPLIHMTTTLPDSLTVLYLSDIPQMVELPSSIKNLSKLTDLKITGCKNLVTLPTGINLESLERINFKGCSRLRTFPDISRNISSLYLEETAIEEVPWWIENFSKLKYLVMQRCSKLEYVYLNISKLKHLELVNFSFCGALTGAYLTDNTSGVSVEAQLPLPEEASSSSLPVPENEVPKVVDFSFINCVNLDLEALLQRHSFGKLIYSGEEIPFYFTHLTTATTLAISLRDVPLSPPFFTFRACAVVVVNTKPTFGPVGVSMKIKCRFKGRPGNYFDSPYQQEYFSVYQKGSHLLLFECRIPLSKEDTHLAEVDYNQVDIKCRISSGNSKIKPKEWGIRLSQDCSTPENRLGDPISTLPRLFEAGGDNRDLNTVKSVGAEQRTM